MDGRQNNGGKRSGQGRPSKSEEQYLIENIHRFIDRDEALLLLKNMMFDDKNFKAVQLYFRYVYGLPVKRIETNIVAEQPLFQIEMIDRDGDSQILTEGRLPIN